MYISPLFVTTSYNRLLYFATGYYSLLQVSTVTTVTAVNTFATDTIVNTVTAVISSFTFCLGLSLYYHVYHAFQFNPKANSVFRTWVNLLL